MKTCSKCHKQKNESEFYVESRYKHLLMSHCKKCHHSYYYNKEKKRLHSIKHPEWRIDKKNRIRAIKQEMVDLLGGKCSKCGYSKCNSALDFHHLDPSIKESTISQLMTRTRSNKEHLKSEVLKCILLCKNCHAELHCSSI